MGLMQGTDLHRPMACRKVMPRLKAKAGHSTLGAVLSVKTISVGIPPAPVVLMYLTKYYLVVTK